MRKMFMASALALLASSSLANANTISGSVYEVSQAVANAATPANVPATPANVTFNVDFPFTFQSGAAYTIGEFLTSAGATVLTNNVPLTDTLDGTLFNFVGTVSVNTGDIFTVTHDDGLTLIIGGLLVVDEPGPTSPVTDMHTYTGPSGNFAFQLVYGECCGAPATLQISLPLSNAVPEPATWGMMLLGFLGLGFAFRQSRRKVSFA